MNLSGELSLAFGVLALRCLSITAITSLPFMYEAIGADHWQRSQRLGYISLVAFIAAMVPLLVKLIWTLKPEAVAK